jgi:hypothetical protein
MPSPLDNQVKYLHSGYILFCKQVEHSEDGLIDIAGLFDIFVEQSFPAKTDCHWVIGFGTPYERRQYNGLITVTNPDGEDVYSRDFQANDPAAIFKGHFIFKPDLTLTKEGLWSAKVTLSNWKDNSVWDLERPFWATIQKDSVPDP